MSHICAMRTVATTLAKARRLLGHMRGAGVVKYTGTLGGDDACGARYWGP